MLRAGHSLKFALVGGFIVSIAITASALTVGRIQGAAWIGQPLELVVPLQLDQESAEGGLCPQADIFDGDSRQDPSQIRISTETGSQSDAAKIRIVSNAPVDEPVVTVYLRVGCAQKVAKRFVLLAEFRGTPPAPTTSPITPAAPLVPPIAVAMATDASPQPTEAASSPGTTVSKATQDKSTSTHPTPQTKPHSTPKASEKAPTASPNRNAVRAPPAGRPHLQLDPAERAPSPTTLPTPTAVSPATTSASAAHPAAAASTAAAVASEPSRPTAEDQVKTLQLDMQRLMEQANTNQMALLAMRQRLEEEHSAKLPLTMLYILLGLIVACLGVLAFAWMRHNALVARQLGTLRNSAANDTHDARDAD